ncbi:MAG: MerR family transcriptional regulator [Cyanobacteria bacterium]|nr:MerR family transcriptional regulator [Cyanobacteriota bacterium]
MIGFTQRETVILARTSPSRLAYLAKTGVVVPHGDRPQRPGGSSGAPKAVYYDWEQILELRAINHLRQKTSLQTIRKIVAFLETHSGDRCLHNKQLIVSDDAVDWVKRHPITQLPQIVQVVGPANQHVGQLKIPALPPVAALVGEVWDAARRSNVIDFERFRQRAGTPQK